MAVTLATFVETFPEFKATADDVSLTPYVQSKLDAAARHVSAAVWGSQYEYAVMLKAAHMLAMSPYGEKMRLNKNSKETVYGVLFAEELRALPIRMLIT